MKLNLERTFTAPFTSMGDSSLTNIYLIAGAITLLALIVVGVVSLPMNAIASVMDSSNPDPGMAALMGILFIIGYFIVIIVTFAAMALPWGYIVETVKLEVYSRSSIMPSWSGNYGNFFWKGIKLQLLMIIYTILIVLICAIPILLTVIIALLTNTMSSDVTVIAGSVGGIISIVIMCIIMLIYSFLFPMIIVTFAAEGKLSEGLNIFKILSKIFSNFLEYILAIIICIMLGVVVMILYVGLICTCCGILVVPLLLYFIYPIICLNMFAQLYKD